MNTSDRLARLPTPSSVSKRLVDFGLRTSLRVADTTVFDLVWLDTHRAARTSTRGDVTVRELSPRELVDYERDPALDLEPGFVDGALAKGDTCVGVFVGEELGSYGWYATGRTSVMSGLTIAWTAAQARYMYKGFTPHRFRGRGLYAAGLARGADLLAQKHGVRAAFALINRRNAPSRAAAVRAGYELAGTFVTCRRFGGHAFLSEQAQRRGVRIEVG